MVVISLHERSKVLVGVIEVGYPRLAVATLIPEPRKQRMLVLLQSYQVNILDGDLGTQPYQNEQQTWSKNQLKYGADRRSLAIDEVLLHQGSKVLAALFHNFFCLI